MAGGPIFPNSVYPTTLNAFPNFHVGAGSNSKHEEGLGIAASLGADTIWRLRFHIPPSLPTGTCKLRIISLANADTGVAKINPKWVSVAMSEDPSAATPVAEGVQTPDWSSGAQSDDYKETKVDLDVDTITASEIVVMDLTFETSSWTLAVVSTHIVSIIWE